MKKQVLFIVLLVIVLVFTTGGLVSYASNDIGDLFTEALFSADSINFQGGSSKINGNAATNTDDVIISGSAKINGDLFIGPGLSPKPEWDAKVSGQILNITEERSFALPEIADFPELDSKGSLTLTGGTSITISEEGQYDSIEINHNNKLTIKTGKAPDGVVRIVIDELNIINGSIVIEGKGTLYLFINKLSLGAATLNINATGSAEKCFVVINSALGSDTLNLAGSSKFTGTFIINTPNFIHGGSARFIGNILFMGSNYLMNGSSARIDGLLYAPNANLTMAGSSTITGAAITKSYVSTASNTLIKTNIPKSFVIPEEIAMFIPPTPEPTPTPTPIPTPTPTPIPTPDPIPEGGRILLKFPYAYLYGYEYGEVGANDPIKRQEASALIYRLMKQNDKLGDFVRPDTATFSDVRPHHWSFSAIEYMTYIGVFDRNRNNVDPLEAITRGEVAKIITFSLRVHPDDNKEVTFDDLPEDNQYYQYIKALVDEGVLIGYEDNTIRPNDIMTRGEFVVIFNRLIGRDDRYDISNQEPLYPDLTDMAHWAYNDIMRASFGFSDEPNENGKYDIDPSRKLPRDQIDYN